MRFTINWLLGKKEKSILHQNDISFNTNMPVKIRLATSTDIEHIVPLFDAYRQFYGQPSDAALAKSFLADRFKLRQSTLFLATDEAGLNVGFTQLFPSFSSVRASRIFILNDLFVMPAARRKGVAALLLKEAEQFARATGAVRLTLATAMNNEAARKLYEAAGWKQDETFCHYNLPL